MSAAELARQSGLSLRVVLRTLTDAGIELKQHLPNPPTVDGLELIEAGVVEPGPARLRSGGIEHHATLRPDGKIVLVDSSVQTIGGAVYHLTGARASGYVAWSVRSEGSGSRSGSCGRGTYAS